MAVSKPEHHTARKRVKRRHVFYIPGYDPFPPRRYRELYRTESAQQARISGYQISQRPMPASDGPYGWHVNAHVDGQESETDIVILQWSDIVRDSMQAGIWATYALLVRTAWVYFSGGVMFRLFRLRAGPGIAAMYPVVMLLGQLVTALAVAALVGWGLAHILPQWLGYLLGLGVVVPILHGFRRIDGKFFVHYLLLDFAFTAKHRGRNPPELDARLDEFAALIAASLQNPDLDEVLVVGHSSGVHLGVSVLARLIRAGHAHGAHPQLGFLSLGHAVPMQSYLPDAQDLRLDLRYLSTRPELFWLDVTAPGDGCCYALCDPVSCSGAAPDSGKRWPLVISAAFTQSLLPETYRKFRRRYFRLHFQYLCAFDAPKDYDYFLITAGPLTLADRFSDRKSSASVSHDCYLPQSARLP
ncbi:hypothetical protein [Roseinatronobacter alkalisoli]|uniref:Alpha/beta hydrolase n=1 Tax=Roseinatronobacter alkalisoli TaxID=3028235 RepID=A0ABT5T8K7_9RHOB|nr:hypothetical protein [Roseinatronobacter sp. HJB301]MDD7970502.1 hypothetical protein [Roseinatronobacter sp. HJB301]